MGCQGESGQPSAFWIIVTLNRNGHRHTNTHKHTNRHTHASCLMLWAWLRTGLRDVCPPHCLLILGCPPLQPGASGPSVSLHILPGTSSEPCRHSGRGGAGRGGAGRGGEGRGGEGRGGEGRSCDVEAELVPVPVPVPISRLVPIITLCKCACNQCKLIMMHPQLTSAHLSSPPLPSPYPPLPSPQLTSHHRSTSPGVGTRTLHLSGVPSSVGLAADSPTTASSCCTGPRIFSARLIMNDYECNFSGF